MTFIGQNRPAYYDSSVQPNTANEVKTSFGAFDLQPVAGETIVPANLGRGPAAVAVNLRVARSWGLGPHVAEPAGRRGSEGGPGGPGGPGGFGGIGGGMRGGGGFSGRAAGGVERATRDASTR